MGGVVTDYYDITVEAESTLVNLKDDVAIDGPHTADMGKLLAGNAVEDTTGVEKSSVINALDASALMAAFDPDGDGFHDGDEKEFDPRADFKRDGVIDEADFDILKANYLQYSPILVVP